MYKPCKYQVKDVFISQLSWVVKLNTVSEIFITNPHQEHHVSQYSKANRRSVTELHWASVYNSQIRCREALTLPAVFFFVYEYLCQNREDVDFWQI